jgi:hypothetical protein
MGMAKNIHRCVTTVCLRCLQQADFRIYGVFAYSLALVLALDMLKRVVNSTKNIFWCTLHDQGTDR